MFIICIKKLESVNLMFIKDKNSRICIRNIKANDIYDLWKIAYDENLEWMEWNGPYFNDPILTFEEFKKIAEKHYINNPYRAIIVFEDKVVGQVSAFWEDGELKNWLEFGILLYDQNTWSRGIGSKVITLWITYLFEITNHIHRIGFTTWSGNKGMIKVGEKIGLTKEAQIRKVRYHQKKYYDSIKYGVLRDEWLTLNEQ